MSNNFLNLSPKQLSFIKTSKLLKSSIFVGLVSALGVTITATALLPPLLAQFPIGIVDKARASEPKLTLRNLNQAQKIYYAQKGKFATSIAQLSASVNPDTQNYRYRIVTNPKLPRQVMMTAQAKRNDVKSYTAAMFVTTVNRNQLTVSGVCETVTASSKLPAMPKPPKKGSVQVQCPAGSRLVVK
ncbi:general secretion pathway protein H [Crinalium epipsammum PCC 9333]|uniref:General secretion pathway protein H n=1 Tax=Crinalium epipsammum PCC 9333 TaxID=1173022 RepID=K9W086_9CYAN|nr:type IV pilin-like G/H family protein [Crinalium epipsammum]AFZ12835.1 general secretion pathway protein H [Crinalium epipsammum PCC 9333]